jgi:PBP1b-binding outer membrane lipoprotein LpoB
MKRALSRMLLAILVFLSGCSTAPVQKEPIIPAKRPASEYVNPNIPHIVEAYDP